MRYTIRKPMTHGLGKATRRRLTERRLRALAAAAGQRFEPLSRATSGSSGQACFG
jgi:hypothetical protein